MAVVQRRPAGRARDYPPLALAGLVMLLLLAVMPSALNLPQENPSETLEYAPVPPEDDQVTPPSGNLSSLGLGSSASLGAGDEGGGAALDEFDSPPAGRSVKAATTKRCVGDPPRQTEDPLSPPCVAYYDGDNGGATYQGVTREEVRVLFYFEGNSGQLGSSRGQEEPCFSRYFDLAEPPDDDEHVFVRAIRPYQRYFNERFQTYGRFVHFFAYCRASNGATAEQRRADAAENYQRIKPFAVVNYGTFGNTKAYTDVMLSKGVLVFTGAQTARFLCCDSQADFARSPGLRWGTAASTEEYAEIFSSLVCAQVVGRPVSFGGNNNQGQARTLGLINNDRSNHRAYGELTRLVRRQVEDCGGEFLYEARSAPPPEGACSPETATAEMAEFQRRGVTTLIWPVGSDTGGDDGCSHFFQSAGVSLRYLPEVVVAANGGSETVLSGQGSHQEFQRNLIIITAYPRGDDLGKAPCAYAAREADPDFPARDIENFACDFYGGVRLLFTGIQVAGPRLGPQSMDKGYHAIPNKASSDPYSEACFFDPGDYTCVKDVQLQHWDPSGHTPGTSGGGCWRMIEGGKRYLAGTWPERDIAALVSLDNPCNRQGYSTS